MKYIYGAFLVSGIVWMFGSVGSNELRAEVRNECLNSYAVSEWDKCEL